MRHDKQNNLLPDQKVVPSKGLLAPHLPKRTVLPPQFHNTDLLSDSSRKRKLAMVDQSSTTCQPVFGYCFQEESNPDQKSGSVLQTNVQDGGSPLKSPFTFRPRYGNLHDQNDFPQTRQTFNKKVHLNEVDKMSNSSLGLSPQLIKTQNVANLQHKEYTSFIQNGTNMALPFARPFNACSEESSSGSQDKLSVNQGNHVLTYPICSKLPDLRPLDLLQHNVVKHEGDAITVDEKTFSQDAGKVEKSFDMEQVDAAGGNQISSVRTGSVGFPASMGGKENVILSQNESKSTSLKEKDHGQTDGNIISMSGSEGSYGKKRSEHALTKKSLPKEGQKDDQSHESLKLNEKSISNAAKIAPLMAEKLWDGSLQLSSSINVSAVAFFKSGEKMPNDNWSEFVEVKGNVRLEAFEKYIQDLPRSRNRGLMVISLCWKEGSSKNTIKGMKEVAKGYKQKERVGLAKVSPGTDLYICPRSDTIITILAKYGFFKGMAAVKDNQDSLIGCVVWKRNQISSNSEMKKSQIPDVSSLKQPLNSPPNLSAQLVAENNNESVKSEGHNEKETMKIESLDDDDDDLPEFDFGLEKMVNGSIHPIVEVKASKKRTFHEGVKVNKKEPPKIQLRKNLFDVDDMPEWCPPDLEIQKKKSVDEFGSTRPPPKSIPSIVPNSNFQNLPQHLLRPTAFTSLPFSSQTYPFQSRHPSGHPERGQSSLNGLNSNPFWRPHHNLNHAGRRG